MMLRYIYPTSITESMLVSSSVPETDYAAWSAVTAYTAGQRVIYAHAIWERLANGTTSTAPNADAVNWVRVGPTNRWACFDQAVGTATSAAGNITFAISPGLVHGLALLDLSADSVQVQMTVAGNVVYSKTISAVALTLDADNWFDWFANSIERRRVVTVTDLPLYGNGVITVTITGAGTVSLGTCVVGMVHDIGEVLAGATVGITDYSVKVRDAFGAVMLTQRGYSDRVTLPLLIRNTSLDNVKRRLARVRATPVVWIGSRRYDSLVPYGLCRDFSIAIPGTQYSTCSLEIDGLI